MAPTATQISLRGFAQRASAIVIVTACLPLLGWWLNIGILKSLVPGFAHMNPLSAILFILLGIALRRAAQRRDEPFRMHQDHVAMGCALAVTLAAAAKLVECMLGLDLDIDQWLFREKLALSGSLPVNEMAPNSALGFLLCGTGLLILDLELRGGERPAQTLFLLAALLTLLALIGYAFGVPPLYTIGSAFPMALPSALLFELYCLGALASRPNRGIMIPVTSNTTGGAIARRLLPAAVLIPLIVGAVHYFGEQRGYFRTEFGLSLFALTNIIVFASLIWWNSKLLYIAESERVRAEWRLSIQNSVARVLAESLALRDGISRILQEMGERLGWHAGVHWMVDEQNSTLRCTDTWQAATDGGDGFVEISRKTVFPLGSGLPGRVWQQREPIWEDDVAAQEGFPRGPAAAGAGLRTGLAFPIQLDNTVFGVVEFFTRETEHPDAVLLQMLRGVGSQIGQFVERQRAEERLKQTTAELARSNAELQHFAYTASHDLSEPLRMIISYLQLLEDRHGEALDSEAREFIGYAVDGAGRMQILMRDLLAYARVGTRERALEHVSADRVLNAALANLKVAIEESGAKIERGPLPTVNADAGQLTQVFQNLVSNALKFRGQKPLQISIGAHRSDGEWVFSIRDNGIGIDPQNFERIFVLFQRLHTRQEYPGTGMGLAICKKIVERHGGRIWVESKAGEGATFYFTIPVTVPSAG